MPLVQRALLSVSDKTGITEFAAELAKRGIEVISTGGTATAIADAGIAVTKVADVTGQKEILDGRVKTLHPKIHGGLLARKSNDKDMSTLDEENIATIDLLAVNLYPFESTIQKGADFATGIENIDIGGPAMIRAAAKNHESVLVAVDPGDYPAILGAIDTNNASSELRRYLAQKAFTLTSRYDMAIETWLADHTGAASQDLDFQAKHAQKLRYGENPHQRADLYLTGDNRPGVALATQIQGKELSYNNLQDADAAFELISEFTEPTAAIIKHTNPCGAASASSLCEAYRQALAGDPTSAFGGIVAMNRKLDAATAGEIVKIFTEVVIATDADEDAIAIMATKPNLRLLTTGGLPNRAHARRTIKGIAGGLLVQDLDQAMVTAADLKIATKRAPTDEEMQSMLFAWKVCKHTRSNAITIARGQCLAGNGAGQTSRIDAATQAASRALDARMPGPLTLASDAFFPFADGLRVAIDAGVSAVIQPGGSMRDCEVIDAADAAGIAMVFTGMRHFKH